MDRNSKLLIVKRLCLILTAVLVLLSLSACNTENRESAQKLSDVIEGEWNGQVDVAKIMYQELSDELGMDVAPEPVYSDMSVEFSGNGECVMIVDLDGFAQAVGKCAEPYVSGIFGFSTEAIVNLIMQAVSSKILDDTGEVRGTYVVDDENGVVEITTEDGEKGTMVWKNGALEYYDDEIDQTIIFKK